MHLLHGGKESFITLHLPEQGGRVFLVLLTTNSTSPLPGCFQGCDVNHTLDRSGQQRCTGSLYRSASHGQHHFMGMCLAAPSTVHCTLWCCWEQRGSCPVCTREGPPEAPPRSVHVPYSQDDLGSFPQATAQKGKCFSIKSYTFWFGRF